MELESDSCSSCPQSSDFSMPSQSLMEKADPSQTTVHDRFTIQMKPGQTVRNYQRELARPGLNGENYIIFAPTNSGKTLVAALVILDHLQQGPQQRKSPKVVMVVKTRLLADQQTKRLKEYIPKARVECSRGNDSEVTEHNEQFPHIGDALPHSDIIVCTAGKLVDGLKKGKVTMREFSLLVMDECHNTEKGSNYAQIMHNYLEEKVTGSHNQLPQVVGLTATPGVGKNPGLNPVKEIDKLVTLCAHMDATVGIKSVQEHIEELNRVVPKSELLQEVVDQSEQRHVFIRRVEEDMKHCEKFLKFEFNESPRWSQHYEQTVKEIKITLEENDNQEDKDKVSTVWLLECLALTLLCYIDLPRELATTPLEEYDKFNVPDKLLSDHEKQLKKMLTKLKSDLSSLPCYENPILEKVKGILTDRYKRNPKSEGIVFVRTREQAEEISKWISKSKFAEELGVRPHMLLGHKKQEEKNPSMSDKEQKRVLRAFHVGEYNLLIATSVAEEGLDIKQCNLVMRLHISSAKSKAQMQGRARAEGSEIVTIVSNDPKKLYRDMLNDEQLLLTEQTVSHNLPSGDHLLHRITGKQIEIMENVRRQRERETLRMSTHPAQNVELKCKKCKVVACRGSDLYFIDKTNHHVVPGDFFCYETVKHHKPGIICGYDDNTVIEKLFKVHCICGASWGALGTWPKSGKEFPVLKCESFNYYIDGIQSNFKQWQKRPFIVLPLSEWFAQKSSQD